MSISSASPQQVESIDEYEARTAAVIVNGRRVEHLDTIGWDQSKDHELVWTLDNRAVWVKATPEITGSVVMHARSPAVPVLEQLWAEDVVFNITAQPAEQEDRGPLTFVGCMATAFNNDDYATGEMPAVTMEWQGVDRS